MAKTQHQQTGNWGEELAVSYLKELGYTIEAQNFRYKRGEIDIIAKQENTYIFIEVKTRSGTGFGYPEDFVDERKQNILVETAGAFLEEKNHEGEIRFDIISILNKDKNKPEVHHIKDAFFPID